MNRLLSEAWEEFQQAISTGERLALDSKYETAFVQQIVEGAVSLRVERDAAPHG